MIDIKTPVNLLPIIRPSYFEPTVFGRYYLVDQISKGGMSDIFLGKVMGMAGFQRPVVIKKLLPNYSTKSRYVKRFINEAKTLSRLNHSNIVQILDMGITDGEYYIAMDYIEGRNVAHIISKASKTARPLSQEFACHIILELAQGLAYAHRKKAPNGENLLLVHQDVNSFNVMVSYEAEVKIIDFGIARIFLDRDSRDGAPVAGKLLYFSPEQLQKKPLDRRVDIYGTGALLYELLSGERLVHHQDTIGDTVRLILEMDIESKVGKDSRIPEDLKPILIRAMAQNPKDRYPWMEDFADDVRAVVRKNNLDFNRAAFSQYLREQFHREILLDRKRMRKLLAEERGRSGFTSTITIPINHSIQGIATLVEGVVNLLEDNTKTDVSQKHPEFVSRGVCYKGGKIIFRQGDLGNELYVIQKGRVRTYLKVGKALQILSELKEGDFFGESALLDGSPRPVSAEAVEDCQLIAFDKEMFARLISQDLAKDVIFSLAERLRDADSFLENCLMTDDLSRLIHAILFFRNRSAAPKTERINLQELQSLFRFRNSEVVKKYLGKLEDLNVIETVDDTVLVKSSEKLGHILNILSCRGKLTLKL